MPRVASGSGAGWIVRSGQTKSGSIRVFTQLPFRTVSVALRGPVVAKVRAYVRTSLSSATGGSPSNWIDWDVR